VLRCERLKWGAGKHRTSVLAVPAKQKLQAPNQVEASLPLGGTVVRSLK
jgi:hypothetical protein